MFVLSLNGKYYFSDLKVPGILFLAGEIIGDLGVFCYNPMFSILGLLLLSVSIIVLWIINIFNNRVLNALKILLIAFGVYSLCFALNGSIYQMSILLIIIELTLPLFIKDDDNQEETKSEQ